MLAIRLPSEIEKRLEKLAKRTGRTKSFYAREAILQHLEDLQIVNVGSVGEAPEGRVAHYTVVLPKVSGAEIYQEWIEY